MDAFYRSRVARPVLFCLAVLPFLLALAAHAGGPTPQESAPGPQRAALAFDQYLVNLGPVPPGRAPAARFAFRNVSDRTIEIKGFETSCGCLAPRLDQRIYRPGESGRFDLQIRTAGEPPGAKQYVVQVQYAVADADGSEPEAAAPPLHAIDLLFKVDLPAHQVVVQPRALAFYDFGTGSEEDGPGEQVLTITDDRARKLRILSVESSSPLLAVRTGEPKEDGTGARSMPVLVAAVDRIPAGRHDVVVTIRTDDPAYPLLRVPIYLHGPDAGP